MPITCPTTRSYPDFILDTPETTDIAAQRDAFSVGTQYFASSPAGVAYINANLLPGVFAPFLTADREVRSRELAAVGSTNREVHLLRYNPAPAAADGYRLFPVRDAGGVWTLTIHDLDTSITTVYTNVSPPVQDFVQGADANTYQLGFAVGKNVVIRVTTPADFGVNVFGSSAMYALRVSPTYADPADIPRADAFPLTRRTHQTSAAVTGFSGNEGVRPFSLTDASGTSIDIISVPELPGSTLDAAYQADLALGLSPTYAYWRSAASTIFALTGPSYVRVPLTLDLATLSNLQVTPEHVFPAIPTGQGTLLNGIVGYVKQNGNTVAAIVCANAEGTLFTITTDPTVPRFLEQSSGFIRAGGTNPFTSFSPVIAMAGVPLYVTLAANPWTASVTYSAQWSEYNQFGITYSFTGVAVGADVGTINELRVYTEEGVWPPAALGPDGYAAPLSCTGDGRGVYEGFAQNLLAGQTEAYVAGPAGGGALLDAVFGPYQPDYLMPSCVSFVPNEVTLASPMTTFILLFDPKTSAFTNVRDDGNILGGLGIPLASAEAPATDTLIGEGIILLIGNIDGSDGAYSIPFRFNGAVNPCGVVEPPPAAVRRVFVTVQWVRVYNSYKLPQPGSNTIPPQTGGPTPT